MKLCFSSGDVYAPSFSALCRLASDYGMRGFEISDPERERAIHPDSILRQDRESQARTMLSDRSLFVPAVVFPQPLDADGTGCGDLVRLIDSAAHAGIENVIVTLAGQTGAGELGRAYEQAFDRATEKDVHILFETSGTLSSSPKALELVGTLARGCTGICWNTRETFFCARESAETTVKTLGAYIMHVRLGDRSGDEDVLLGEGELPVEPVLRALASLNYEGCISCLWNSQITDPDIVLTHFVSFISSFGKAASGVRSALPTNRAGTGTFAWKKFEPVELTFSEVLDRMVELYPDQYAFKYTTLDYTRTYSQFRDDVDRVAAAFIALGVRPGHHVAIWATNVPQWFLTFWAAVKIGAVLVTVNTAYKVHEAEYLLRQSDTHTLVMIESVKDSDYRGIIRELCPELEGHVPGTPLYAAGLPFLRNVITVGFEMDGALSWERMLALADRVPLREVRRRASLVRCDDVCNMQYTSGTTGFPKGVMLTHRNIVNNGKTIGDRMDMSTADRMMIQVPMFHCFGMVLSMTSMMTHGGTLCPMPYFSPKSSLACINQEKITCFNGVPTMFIAMFNHPDFATTDFSHMRTGIMAGSNCPPDLMKRASIEMHMTEILSVYGQTESSPGCTMGEVNESLALRTETVGSAFEGVECRIIDPETGAALPDGQSGEFVARGYNVMKGYYKMPEATAQTIDADGWLHTGDLCCRTAEGYYRVTGRLKDMIIRGGENIYPREIEEFYLTNPKVRDVQVVGVPDKVYGEEACAWIILHKGQSADEQEMRAYGQSSMARHKVPRYFLFVDSFPMNAAGKILKYKMKEDSALRLGLN
ncbi:MAG: AMP-binding protein [Spirochaetales bacterium]|nr:AMP-binding protein [Spirochaetales bacterium]